MNSKRAKAFATLRDLEALLLSQLSRLPRADRRVDSPFIRALAEIHSLLAIGLNAVEPRLGGVFPAEEESPSTPAEVQVGGGSGERAWVCEPAQRENEFLLDYALELRCLEREKKLARRFAPRALRSRFSPREREYQAQSPGKGEENR